MNSKSVITPGGERLVILSEADYAALLGAAEDNADCETLARFRRALASGEEELIPSDVVDHFCAAKTESGCGVSIAA